MRQWTLALAVTLITVITIPASGQPSSPLSPEAFAERIGGYEIEIGKIMSRVFELVADLNTASSKSEGIEQDAYHTMAAFVGTAAGNEIGSFGRHLTSYGTAVLIYRFNGVTLPPFDEIDLQDPELNLNPDERIALMALVINVNSHEAIMESGDILGTASKTLSDLVDVIQNDHIRRIVGGIKDEIQKARSIIEKTTELSRPPRASYSPDP